MSDAFVRSSTWSLRDRDGDYTQSDEQRTWLFPEGLAEGRPVHFFSEHHHADGNCRVGSMHHEWSELLAEGIVAELCGEEVAFVWAGAVRREKAATESDEGAWGRWEQANLPEASLLMEEKCESDRRGETRSRFEQGRELLVSKGGWKALRRPVLVAMLLEEDCCASLVLLSGEVAAESDRTCKVGDLVELLKVCMGLESFTQVRVVDGEGRLVSMKRHVLEGLSFRQ